MLDWYGGIKPVKNLVSLDGAHGLKFVVYWLSAAQNSVNAACFLRKIGIEVQNIHSQNVFFPQPVQTRLYVEVIFDIGFGIGYYKGVDLVEYIKKLFDVTS